MSKQEATSALTAGNLEPGMTVNDLAASIRFYEAVGFVVDERWESEGTLRGVRLRAGDARFGISQDDWAKGRDRIKGVGVRLYMETDQDIDAVATRIKHAGLTLDADPEDMPWGGRAFGITDPDGYRLTIATPS